MTDPTQQGQVDHACEITAEVVRIATSCLPMSTTEFVQAVHPLLEPLDRLVLEAVTASVAAVLRAALVGTTATFTDDKAPGDGA